MALNMGAPSVNPLGGGMANMLGAAYMQSNFNKLLSGAQQPINIDALRGITDPRIMQMAFQMIMANQSAGTNMGAMPFGWQYLPQEKWPEAAAIAAGLQPRAGEVSDREIDYSTQLRRWQEIRDAAMGLDIDIEDIDDPARKRRALQAEAQIERLMSLAGSQEAQTEKPTATDEVPTGLKAIWPNLNEEERQTARELIKRGVKPTTIIKEIQKAK